MFNKILKLVGVFTIILLLFFSLTSCDDISSPEFYSLTVEMEGEGEVLSEDGDVIVDSTNNTSAIDVEANTITEVRAVPASNWILIEWANEGFTHRNRSLYVGEDKNIKAIFGTLDILEVDYEKNSYDYWEFNILTENISGYEIGYIELHVYLYDDNDNRIGHGWTNETDIPDGEKISWSILTTDKEFDYYKTEIKR